ncbi:hypothetical protein P175DRAFT_0492041 [Aspergillus ochraceoroseus IBT 24754]|uniref:Mid2 domain-containing protein n=2 Tax=Aspergillus ochraceoroseus TaxID=138278 RepID=A0A2T5LYK7_9EURO|nr:uncharacterized protein P175DRAFT_0492041 [Aspergillus ochraceoroseus IBT 24754]KKK17320.1 hypothetical protein AOCH_002444 [Aspergillus ochraceoroseus]PTU21365.1 hypothetical protein P175DRAFT_0492041 [Aspergillus ochraceoroseus IBT 24754]
MASHGLSRHGRYERLLRKHRLDTHHHGEKKVLDTRAVLESSEQADEWSSVLDRRQQVESQTTATLPPPESITATTTTAAPDPITTISGSTSSSDPPSDPSVTISTTTAAETSLTSTTTETTVPAETTTDPITSPPSSTSGSTALGTTSNTASTSFTSSTTSPTVSITPRKTTTTPPVNTLGGSIGITLSFQGSSIDIPTAVVSLATLLPSSTSTTSVRDTTSVISSGETSSSSAYSSTTTPITTTTTTPSVTTSSTTTTTPTTPTTTTTTTTSRTSTSTASYPHYSDPSSNSGNSGHSGGTVLGNEGGGSNSTSTVTPSPTGSSSGSGSLDAQTTGKIVGGVVGGVAGATIFFLLLFLLLRRRKKGLLFAAPAGLTEGDGSGAGAGAAEGSTRQMVVRSSNKDSIFGAAYFAPALMKRWRQSRQSAGEESILSSEPSERGFQKISGRKLPTGVQPGLEYSTSGLDAGSPTGSDYSTTLPPVLPRSPISQPPPSVPYGMPLDASYTREAAEDDVVVFRPSPARTPVAGMANPPTGTEASTVRTSGAFPMPPATPSMAIPKRPDALGRSHPSYDGSRGSRFTESL